MAGPSGTPTPVISPGGLRSYTPGSGSGHEPGPIEKQILRIVETVSSVLVPIILVLVIAGAMYAFGAFDLVRAFGVPILKDIVYDALAGATLGALLGFLRFRARLSKRAEDIVDAVATPEVVSALRIGVSYAVAYSIAGGLAGVVVGWLGLPIPKLISGEASAVLAQATPLVGWMVGAGGGGGGPLGGGFGGEGAGLLGLSVFVLIAVVLALLATAALMLGMGGIAKAITSGATQMVGKAFGIAFGLAITRLGAASSWRLRRPSKRTPFAFDSAVDVFASEHPELRFARTHLGNFFRWLREQGVTPSEDLPDEWIARYESVAKTRGAHQSATVVRSFFLWTGREMKDRVSRPAPIEATNDVAWLNMVAQEVFSKGWVKRTLAEGAFAGAILGAVQAILAEALLYFLK